MSRSDLVLISFWMRTILWISYSFAFCIGGVPTTPDPNTSAKVSRYNGRRIAIEIGGVYTTFCQKEGILLQKYRDRNARFIPIPFRSIRVRGRFYSFAYRRVSRLLRFMKINFHPHPQPQNSLPRIFRLQPDLERKFLLRRTWSGQKLLPLQFPRLSLPQ